MIDLKKIENSADCISGYDDHMKITIWNIAVAKKYGIDKEKALGSDLLELFPRIKDDFRVRCFRESARENKVFFFSALPYAYEQGFYTQLILPDKQKKHFSVLSIVRNHTRNGHFLKKDLLDSLLADREMR